ncbi:MAG: HK97 gp10 family phage protein [Actinomycetota bacterium]|nr:HK97 gp10 family phage protein [Actinomycetota bacterium]
MHITGLEELLKALGSLPKKVARQAIRKPLREGAKIVLAEAKRNVPKGKTGNLKRSLKVRAGKRKKGTISIRVVTSEGWFKGDTFYGAFVEYGTHKMEARNYVRNAYNTTKDRVRKLIERGIVKNIDQAVRELKATS